MADDQRMSIDIELTAEIVSAYVGNNPLSADQIPALLRSVHSEISSLSAGTVVQEPEQASEPAVSIKKSVKKDQLTCLECGKTFKAIKRHLITSHDLTPTAYREKWNLKPEYPMVASNYSEARSKLALELVLDQKRAD